MDVVSVNNSDMFDDVSHTQGGVPHLMQFLWDQYVESIRKKIVARKKKKLASVALPEALKRASAKHFIQFAANYLETNRVSQTFFIDENCGLMLRNQKAVAVSPGVEIRGTMQDSGAVEITQGKSQEGLEGVVATGRNMSFGI